MGSKGGTIESPRVGKSAIGEAAHERIRIETSPSDDWMSFDSSGNKTASFLDNHNWSRCRCRGRALNRLPGHKLINRFRVGNSFSDLKTV